MSEDDQPRLQDAGDGADAAVSKLLAGPSPVNMVHGAIESGLVALQRQRRPRSEGTSSDFSPLAVQAS